MKELVVKDKTQFKNKIGRLKDKVELFKEDKTFIEKTRDEVMDLLY